MKCKATHPDGRVEEFTFSGDNLALGLAAVKHVCVCGESRFVDGGDVIDCQCGIKLEYFDDEQEQTGYLHESADA